MLIQCTKKLLDVIERKPVSYEEENLLFSWHANLITLNRSNEIRKGNKVIRVYSTVQKVVICL
ncbi:hypothetical protein SAMN02745195_01602 [Thermoanaerobacter uzonensis DSM 18761]|uniref:DUF6933 domain-containing protein n=1 Tax=Thermoanaerobacter uzonensis DSM 18761 TaxID=1123369 RepID=A0A1M4Y058_9THEO|nr:hypothetical protein [Thermoanaerobacter uzonensis]SHE99224.1 hypothetical protein SAMN02745195_01602 [Thermoanaerobacter uzonensis DSM 18761]